MSTDAVVVGLVVVVVVVMLMFEDTKWVKEMKEMVAMGRIDVTVQQRQKGLNSGKRTVDRCQTNESLVPTEVN